MSSERKLSAPVELKSSEMKFFSPTHGDSAFLKELQSAIDEVEVQLTSFIHQITADFPIAKLLGRDCKSLNEEDLEFCAKAYDTSIADVKETLQSFSISRRGAALFENFISSPIKKKYPLFDSEDYLQSVSHLAVIKKEMHQALESGSPEKLQRLYDSIAALFIQYAWKNTIITKKEDNSFNFAPMSEVRQKYADLFYSLFERNVNVTFKVYGHNSCLLSHLTDPKQLEEIVKKGANFNVLGFIQNTPLMTEIALAHNAKAMLLLTLGEKYRQSAPPEFQINLDHQDELRGNTALILAIAKGHPKGHEGDDTAPSNMEITEKLLSMKANPNIPDKSGNTALHVACVRRERKTIEMLLLAGADSRLKNAAGLTPSEMLSLDYDQANRFLRRQTTTAENDMVCHTLKITSFATADVEELRTLLNRPSEKLGISS